MLGRVKLVYVRLGQVMPCLATLGLVSPS